MHELGEWGLGRPFLFRPKKVKKGNSMREPCDLAWVSDRAIILFYLRSSSKDTFEQATKHNLNEAKGWMRTWRHPALQAQLGPETASIPTAEDFSLDKPVHILSLVECSSPSAQSLPDFAIAIGAHSCVSMPLRAVTELIHQGGGFEDLLSLVAQIEASVRKMDEIETMRMVLIYCQKAWVRSGASTVWPHGRFDNRYIDIANIIHTLRIATLDRVSEGTEEARKSDLQVKDLLVHTNVEELYRIIATIRRLADRCLPIRTSQKFDQIDLEECKRFFLDYCVKTLELGFNKAVPSTIPKPLALYDAGHLRAWSPSTGSYVEQLNIGGSKLIVAVSRPPQYLDLLNKISCIGSRGDSLLVTIFVTAMGYMVLFSEPI